MARHADHDKGQDEARNKLRWNQDEVIHCRNQSVILLILTARKHVWLQKELRSTFLFTSSRRDPSSLSAVFHDSFIAAVAAFALSSFCSF